MLEKFLYIKIFKNNYEKFNESQQILYSQTYVEISVHPKTIRYPVVAGRRKWPQGRGHTGNQ